MIPDESAVAPRNAPRPYEAPALIEVFIDPAKDMLVACAPAKTPTHGGPKCATVQFT
jgi:hypothetical protein